MASPAKIAMALEQSANISLFGDTRQIVYFTAIPVILVVILGTTLHFLYRRHHPIIYNRDVPLTLLNIMANAIVSVLHLTKTINYYNYPCFIMLWIPAIVYPLYILTIFARLTRIIFMYRLSEARLQAIDLRTLPMRSYNGLGSSMREMDQEKLTNTNSWEVPHDDMAMNMHHITLSAPDNQCKPNMKSFDNVPSHCHWSLSYRRRFTTRALCISIGILLIVHVVLTLIMQLRYPSEFTWMPAKLGRCGHSAAYLPLWISCGFYIIFIAPFIVYHARGIHDAYGIRVEHFFAQGIALFFFALYFLFKWLGFDNNNVFPAAMWLVIGTLIAHLWTVARPAWLAERHIKGNRKNSCDSLERIQGIAEFKMLLDDPIWRREFRLYSVRDFSVENILFYEEVMRLQIDRYSTHRSNSLFKDDHELATIPETSAEGMDSPVMASLPKSEYTDNSSVFSPELARSRSFSRSSQVSEAHTLGGFSEDEILTYCNAHQQDDNYGHNKRLDPLDAIRHNRLRVRSLGAITTVANYMSEQARHHSVPPMLTHSDSLDNDLDLEPKPLPRELINGLREIYKLFLRPDAEYELNLSHQVRRNVLQQFEQNDLTADILQPAVTEILMLMYLNTYPRFLDWIDRQGSKNHISRRGSSKCWSLNSSVVGRKTRAAFGVDSDELRSGLALRMAKENGW